MHQLCSLNCAKTLTKVLHCSTHAVVRIGRATWLLLWWRKLGGHIGRAAGVAGGCPSGHHSRAGRARQQACQPLSRTRACSI